MLTRCFASSSRATLLHCSARRAQTHLHARWLQTYDTKYADKLRKIAEGRGKTVDELRAELRTQELEKRKEQLKTAAQKLSQSQGLASSPTDTGAPATGVAKRSDNSPVKPLSSIFNLARLLETPHTAEQVGTLWQAYHASRSRGTGRGFLCATVPVDIYQKLINIGKKYPSFVLPLPRESGDISPDGHPQKAYEFYFLQWALHGSPPVPTYEKETSLFPTPTPADEGSNPPTATVMFTPLQEYKLRQAFSTPYLVLTFYTELAASHGVVLLRGEITPSTTSAPTPGEAEDGGEVRYFLGQQDAQLLAMGMQRFYLWNDGHGVSGREELLKAFYEKPEEFKWEELLKHAEIA